MIILDRKSLTIDDFFTGFIAGLALRGVKVVSVRHALFHEAMERGFQAVNADLKDQGLNVRFAIRRNRVHGDAPDVVEGLAGAVQRRLISLGNIEPGEIRLNITAESALAYLQYVPGDSATYLRLADVFLERIDRG